jgi:SAM-dependent methyltransferase
MTERLAATHDEGAGAAASLVDSAEIAAVAATLEQLLPSALVPLFDASFVRSDILFDAFVSELAAQAFQATGLEAAAAEPGSAEEIATRAGLPLDRVPALRWLLRRLAARQALEESDAGDGVRRFRVGHPLRAPDPGPFRAEQQRHDPASLPSYVLAETVAHEYPAFLRGEATGERILFSPARFRLWGEYFSNENTLYAVNNRVGAIAIEEWMPGGEAAILELGGGLASATTAVLDRLRGSGQLGAIREYRVTELVPAFLRRGQHAVESGFPEASFVTFAPLDMNRSFEEQEVAAGSRSIVYAVNTLHVARDLAFTLGEILRTLQPGGRLIVSECVRPHAGQTIYAEFIFNLMETFRAPVLHPTYRPNGGFLTPEQWTAALRAAGFTDVQFLPNIARVREAIPAFSVAAISATRPS